MDTPIDRSIDAMVKEHGEAEAYMWATRANVESMGMMVDIKGGPFAETKRTCIATTLKALDGVFATSMDKLTDAEATCVANIVTTLTMALLTTIEGCMSSAHWAKFLGTHLTIAIRLGHMIARQGLQAPTVEEKVEEAVLA